MSDHFNLSAARMMWAMGICSDGIRTYLDGALIEPLDTGALIVATNGKAMLIQHDAQAVAPRRAILRLTPPEPSERDEYELWDEYDDASRGWRWGSSRVHVPADVCDGARAAPVDWHMRPAGTYMIAQEAAPADLYPDWRKAWRSPHGGEKIHMAGGMQMALLAQLAGPRNQIRLLPRGGPGTPYVVSFADDESALGLLMPCAVKEWDDDARADMLRIAGLAEEGA